MSNKVKRTNCLRCVRSLRYSIIGVRDEYCKCKIARTILEEKIDPSNCPYYKKVK